MGLEDSEELDQLRAFAEGFVTAVHEAQRAVISEPFDEAKRRVAVVRAQVCGPLAMSLENTLQLNRFEDESLRPLDEQTRQLAQVGKRHILGLGRYATDGGSRFVVFVSSDCRFGGQPPTKEVEARLWVEVGEHGFRVREMQNAAWRSECVDGIPRTVAARERLQPNFPENGCSPRTENGCSRISGRERLQPNFRPISGIPENGCSRISGRFPEFRFFAELFLVRELSVQPEFWSCWCVCVSPRGTCV